MARWQGAPEPDFARLGPVASIRAAIRAIILVGATLILLPVYWGALLLEKLLPKLGLSTFIIWFWCAMGTWLCGLKLMVEGTPMPMAGARVANHSSWADIFVLRSAAQMYYVAKSEVRSWPLMGMIGAHTGTMFIDRDPRQAKKQEAMFLERLENGDRLVFFPEGTSSDSLRVLPFKSTLFSAFMQPAVADHMWLQPVSVVYHPQDGLAANFFGWWGEMPFGAHLWQVFGRSTRSRVWVIFHDAVRAADFPDRKTLAAHCEAQVRAGHSGKLAELGRQPQ